MKKDLETLKRLIGLDYKRHIRQFDQLKPLKPIVLLGDSMIAYFPVKAFHLENRIYNLGIPGDTTVGVLNRVEQVVKLKPNVIVLHVGINDFVLTNLKKGETLKNILEIRHTILEKCPNSEVYIVALTPINQKDFKDQLYLLNRHKNDAHILNEMLRKVVDKDHFIDIYDKLTDDIGDLAISLTSDGIHLNQKGYQIYLDALKDIIEI